MLLKRISFFLKSLLRTLLGPLFPVLYAIRSLPEKKRAASLARALELSNTISVCYLTSKFPLRPALRTEYSNGGAVKLTFLAETFPHSYPQACILYSVSSVDHFAKTTIISAAKKKGIKIVVNQNGVAYPAWNKTGWVELNKKLANALHLADFIIYQSEFCKLSAQKYLGTPEAPSQIIYNPVDLDLYKPKGKNPKRFGPVLLLGGNQYERYRFESAIEILLITRQLLPNARLIVTGKLWGEDPKNSMQLAIENLKKKGLQDVVEFTGTYSQKEAPNIFNLSDILIHTKYNDPSPNLISEALASGLPIVYSNSGGVPELVGMDAGIGITVEQSWEKISVPSPILMSDAIARIWEDITIFSEAARQRSIEKFSLYNFILAHRQAFEQLLGD